MSSYQKYIVMGVSTLLLPLAKKAFQKLVSKYTGESREDSTVNKSEKLIRATRLSDRRAG